MGRWGAFEKSPRQSLPEHLRCTFPRAPALYICPFQVQAPEEFDVLLCPNLYGDLISDLAGGIIGFVACAGTRAGSQCTSARPDTLALFL